MTTLVVLVFRVLITHDLDNGILIFIYKYFNYLWQLVRNQLLCEHRIYIVIIVLVTTI